jgi:uncharacterized membrane protein
MLDIIFKSFLLIVGFILIGKILSYISHKLAIVNITYKLNKILKNYSIIKDVILIEKHPKRDYLIFNVILDTGELVMETLIGNDPTKPIKDSTNAFIHDIYHDSCWNIQVNFIDN